MVRSRFLGSFVVLLAACEGELGGGESVATDVALVVRAGDWTEVALDIAGWELRSGAPGLQVVALDERAEPAGALLINAGEDEAGDPVLSIETKLGERGELVVDRSGVKEASVPSGPRSRRWLEALSRDVLSVGTEPIGYAFAGACGDSLLGVARACAETALACDPAGDAECLVHARRCAARAMSSRRCARGRPDLAAVVPPIRL